jgi:putative mRNA 3-end processing factor
MAQLLTFTDAGIHCPEGGFYIDPWGSVDRALITHGHADHARPGHGAYLSTRDAAPVITHRLGVVPESVEYGETRRIGGVEVTFFPAGHVPGSAQIRVARGGEVWVVSGDYKTVADGLSEPFEPVRCDAFVSECTFGLPVFNWAAQAEVVGEINAWWRGAAEAGRVAMIGAYSLGKAQRIIASVDHGIGPVLTHGAVENVNAVMRSQGIALPQTVLVTPDMPRERFRGALVVAPPSALGSPWARRFGDVTAAVASGWMALRGVRRRRGVDRGFVMSDHADWAGLNAAIVATGAERIFVTHGYTAPFRRWLQEAGFDAHVVATEFEGESIDTPEDAE